jgi:hypothetical protein
MRARRHADGNGGRGSRATPVFFTGAPPSGSWRVDPSEEEGETAHAPAGGGMGGAVLWRGAGCVTYLAKIFDVRNLGISVYCEMVEFCWSGNSRST